MAASLPYSRISSLYLKKPSCPAIKRGQKRQFSEILGRTNRQFGRNRLRQHFNGGNRNTIGKNPNINRTEG